MLQDDFLVSTDAPCLLLKTICIPGQESWMHRSCTSSNKTESPMFKHLILSPCKEKILTKIFLFLGVLPSLWESHTFITAATKCTLMLNYKELYDGFPQEQLAKAKAYTLLLQKNKINVTSVTKYRFLILTQLISSQGISGSGLIEPTKFEIANSSLQS